MGTCLFLHVIDIVCVSNLIARVSLYLILVELGETEFVPTTEIKKGYKPEPGDPDSDEEHFSDTDEDTDD